MVLFSVTLIDVLFSVLSFATAELEDVVFKLGLGVLVFLMEGTTKGLLNGFTDSLETGFEAIIEDVLVAVCFIFAESSLLFFLSPIFMMLVFESFLLALLTSSAETFFTIFNTGADSVIFLLLSTVFFVTELLIFSVVASFCWLLGFGTDLTELDAGESLVLSLANFFFASAAAFITFLISLGSILFTLGTTGIIAASFMGVLDFVSLLFTSGLAVSVTFLSFFSAVFSSASSPLCKPSSIIIFIVSSCIPAILATF
mmetsp:Transcript_30326/g.28973  ORF Transcript_30326/g.28973 Transcript_30326/m.28973 type:complete len:257 (-) Transcript_30326:106-876(-)